MSSPGGDPETPSPTTVVGLGLVLVAVVALALVGTGSVDDPGGGDEPTSPTPTASATPPPAAGSPATTPSPTVPRSTYTEPAPRSFAGAGDERTEPFGAAGGLVAVEFEHDGSGPFAVELVGGDGEQIEQLANGTGPYDGTVALNLSEGTYRLAVEADGKWRATVRQPRFRLADARRPPIAAGGRFDGYVGPVSLGGTVEVSVSVAGEGTVTVWLAGHDGERIQRLAAGDAPYERRTAVGGFGPALLVVESDGAEWQVAVQRPR